MLKSVCSVKEYVEALMKTFTTPGCIPKDIEEVRYCYDTSTIVDSMDSYMASSRKVVAGSPKKPQKSGGKCLKTHVLC